MFPEPSARRAKLLRLDRPKESGPSPTKDFVEEAFVKLIKWHDPCCVIGGNTLYPLDRDLFCVEESIKVLRHALVSMECIYDALIYCGDDISSSVMLFLRMLITEPAPEKVDPERLEPPYAPIYERALAWKTALEDCGSQNAWHKLKPSQFAALAVQLDNTTPSSFDREHASKAADVAIDWQKLPRLCDASRATAFFFIIGRLLETNECGRRMTGLLETRPAQDLRDSRYRDRREFDE